MQPKMIILLAALVVLSGCAASRQAERGALGEPVGEGTEGAVAANPSPMPVESVAAAVRSGAKGDLSVVIGGDCRIVKDGQGALWLKLTLAVNWIGTAFPSTSYRITATHGNRSATDAVTASANLTAAIGGEPAVSNAFLGQQVVLTVTVDPQNQVAEVSEANNSVKIAVSVPASAPGDTQEHSVPCTKG
jgi:hypothetical protein